MNSSITSDAPDAYEAPKAFYNWFEEHIGPLKMSWPSLVGSDALRAECIVRFGSPFYVVTEPYKISRKAQLERFYTYDPLRVILFLDSQGCVATGPRVG
jgi:hypothetical protein